MGLLSRHKKVKQEMETYYKTIGQVLCPFFSKEIIFTSEGFNHLMWSDGRERSKSNQMLKFDLFPLVPDIVRKSGTVQEYRKQLCKYGKRKANGFFDMKEMEFWGFVAIVKSHDQYIKVKVILRKVGDGNVTFWSVMPDGNLKNKDTFHLAKGDLTED